MLHSIDHPKALAFTAQELAAIQKRIEGTKAFSPFVSMVAREWRRAQEEGRPMSDESRELLLRLWRNDENDKFLRIEAFSLWAATKQEDDLNVLRTTLVPEYLADHILQQRLVRGDHQAIPAMIEKLRTNDNYYWWHQGRYLWSPELTDELDKFLSNRGECVAGSITSELIMRLPTKEAERLLLKTLGSPLLLILLCSSCVVCCDEAFVGGRSHRDQRLSKASRTYDVFAYAFRNKGKRSPRPQTRESSARSRPLLGLAV